MYIYIILSTKVICIYRQIDIRNRTLSFNDWIACWCVWVFGCVRTRPRVCV